MSRLHNFSSVGDKTSHFISITPFAWQFMAQFSTDVSLFYQQSLFCNLSRLYLSAFYCLQNTWTLYLKKKNLTNSFNLPGVGDTIGIGPESRYQRAWYRNQNRILHIPGSQYRSRYRIFLFLGTPLNKLGHFFIFYLITFAKSWYQYRNRYRILPIPGSRIGIGIAQNFNLVSES